VYFALPWPPCRPTAEGLGRTKELQLQRFLHRLQTKRPHRRLVVMAAVVADRQETDLRLVRQMIFLEMARSQIVAMCPSRRGQNRRMRLNQLERLAAQGTIVKCN
jgi:hypothetical protein